MQNGIHMRNLLVGEKVVDTLKLFYTLDLVWTGMGFDNTMTSNFYSATSPVTKYESDDAIMINFFVIKTRHVDQVGYVLNSVSSAT